MIIYFYLKIWIFSFAEYLHTDYKLLARAAVLARDYHVTSRCESLFLKWKLKCWHLQDTGVRMHEDSAKSYFKCTMPCILGSFL